MLIMVLFICQIRYGHGLGSWLYTLLFPNILALAKALWEWIMFTHSAINPAYVSA